MLCPGSLKLKEVEDLLNLAEDRLSKKRQEVVTLQDQLSQMKRKYDTEYDLKLKDSSREARELADSEWKGRLQAVELRASEENDNLKRELQSAVHRISELQSKFKSNQNLKSDAPFSELSDVSCNIDFNCAVNELKSTCSKQMEIIESLRNENRSVNEQLDGSLKRLKVIEDEYEIAKQDASTTVIDNQVVHNALVQATQRLHDADLASNSLRAENSVLSMKLKNSNDELSALTKHSHEKSERIISIELNNKRLKNDYAEQCNRYSTKIKELESFTSVLQDQINQQEQEFLRRQDNLEGILKTKSFEITQLKDELLRSESKYQSTIQMINQMRGEMKSNEEELLEKDIALKSVKRGHELEISSLHQVQNDLKLNIDNLKCKLHGIECHEKELQAKYVDDFLAIEREIEITLPKLADDIASKVDKNWENRMKGEIGSVQMKYETEIESMREEILEMHASFAERDARRRVQLACERAEIENMRSLVTSLKHTFGAEDKSFAPFKCFSASHLQNSEIDVLRKDSERRVGSEEHENEHAYVRAFSLLQAQVNTMKSELNNTMTQQTRFSSKSLTTVSHIYSDVGEDNFCGICFQNKHICS